MKVLLIGLLMLTLCQMGVSMKYTLQEFLTKRTEIDWCGLMRITSAKPIADTVFYSNGIIVTADHDDRVSHQSFMVAYNSPIPDTLSCRATLLELDTANVYDFAAGDAYTGCYDRLQGSRVSYEGDRISIELRYNNTLKARIEEFIPWGVNAVVHRVILERHPGVPVGDPRVRAAVRCFSRELSRMDYNREKRYLHLSDPDLPFHVVVMVDKEVESFAVDPPNFGIPGKDPFPNEIKRRPWRKVGVLGLLFSLEPGDTEEYFVAFGFGLSEEEALAQAEAALKDPGSLSHSTRSFWNAYLGSCPLLVLGEPLAYVHGPTGERREIPPEELLKKELWHWRGLLVSVARAPYLKCSPLTVADWGEFVGMWSNDGIEEAVALSYTNQHPLARECLINWFDHAVNYKGDGHCVWTLYPSGLTSFDHHGALDEKTEGVLVAARAIGQYVRATGDTGILGETLTSPHAKGRSLWEQLKAYEENLLAVRDINDDHLVDWIHMYETGWDNKSSPFVDRNGAPTTAVNEQVFRLWSLSEMAYLAALREEDPRPWRDEFERVRREVEEKLWSATDSFYHDLDINRENLWLSARNLDAFYWLYFETDPERKEKLLQALKDPNEFSASLLPTLSMRSPRFRRDGYWDGRAWPREHAYVGVALGRAGHPLLGLEWVARAITASPGPVLAETLDPLADPVEFSFVGPCRLMGYNALNCLALVDIAGLRMWDGEGFIIVPQGDLPRLLILNHKWNGKTYHALLEPEKGLFLYNEGGEELLGLGEGGIFRVRELGDGGVELECEVFGSPSLYLARGGIVYKDGVRRGEATPGGRVQLDKGTYRIRVDFPGGG